MVRFNPLVLCVSASAHFAAGAAESSFDWSSVTPSEKLAYSPCFDEYQCARLILPLDWRNETNNGSVTIAIIKLPATVPEDDPAFGGAIFTNPGGPGGSGTQYLRMVGKQFQDIVDVPGKRHYEMVSFDPRGIGASEPLVDCYPANGMARRAGVLESVASGMLDLSPASFAYGYYTTKSFGRRCEKTNADILPFVNTPSVARDMVAMVDKIAELRHDEGEDGQHVDGSIELRREKQASDDVPRLQYIGISYGTVLGNYFASLFPERVGRVVLDGVCDSDDYANGVGWLTNTQDSDKMMELFFEGCFNAGSDICKLRQPNDKSPSDISKRTWSWIKSRDAEPIETTTPDGSTDILLRSGDIHTLLGLNLYGADFTFAKLANLLADAIEGNIEPIATAILDVYGFSNLNDACVIDNSTAPLPPDASREPQSAVLCSDGDDVTDKNATFWNNYLAEQSSISSLFGALWTGVRLSCSAWRVRPNWSFKGPFTTPQASQDPAAPEAGRPAAPLLFLSSRWDPVTPLRNARAMAKAHPGAGVLVGEAMGHSLIGHGLASECTRKVVSKYFHKGVVPKEEMACEGVKDPWDTVSVQDAHVQKLINRRTRYNLLGM